MADTQHDRDALLHSIRTFMETERFKHASILAAFTAEDIAPITKAIEGCSIYRRVAHKAAFSSNKDIPLSASDLADKLAFRVHTDQAPEEAVDWLVRLLTTEVADGIFVAVIWGLDIAKAASLAEGIELVPFSQLPSSSIKSRIVERGARSPGWFAWWSDREWGPPGAAYVAKLRSFAYFDAQATRQKVDELYQDGRRIWTLLEVLVAKHPLVFGYWFQYENEELDLGAFDIFMTLSTPEVPPRIKHHAVAAADALPLLHSFDALSTEYQDRLLRAANRFALSKCRLQRVDLVLDLALAYEIAVSGRGDQGLSPTWKVSTRTAQMIGGDLATRMETRAAVRKFYQLRNEATHGGSLSKPELIALIDEAAEIFPELLAKLISYGSPPDWAAVEIEPTNVATSPPLST